MRMKLSGLPLCKAGDWGLQTPENILFVVFFCGYAAKVAPRNIVDWILPWGMLFFRLRRKNNIPHQNGGCEGTASPRNPLDETH